MVFYKINYCLICNKKIEVGNLFCDICRKKDVFERIRVFRDYEKSKFKQRKKQKEKI